MKTSDLEGAALDWVVCQLEKQEWYPLQFGKSWYRPSTNWAQAGPIIEREGISVTTEQALGNSAKGWRATFSYHVDAHGETPLIAAMRCYVASKLGDEVDLPKELI